MRIDMGRPMKKKDQIDVWKIEKEYIFDEDQYIIINNKTINNKTCNKKEENCLIP